MRVEVNIDSDAVIDALRADSWNVGQWRYQELEIKVKMAVSDLLQEQVDADVTVLAKQIVSRLGLTKVPKQKKGKAKVEPPQQRSVRPYIILREE